MCACVCGDCVSEGSSLFEAGEKFIHWLVCFHEGTLYTNRNSWLETVLVLNCGHAEPPKKLQDQIKVGGSVGREGYEWSEFY